MVGGNLACFTLQRVAEKYAFVAGVADRLDGGAKRISGPRHEAELRCRELPVTWLWTFISRILQCTPNFVCHTQPAARDDAASIGESRRIRHRRARSDRGWVITGYVRNRQGHHACRMGSQRKPPAFDAR